MGSDTTDMTTIWVSRQTSRLLAKLARKGESKEKVVLRGIACLQKHELPASA